MMKNLQKIGGVAALYEAGAYIVAMVIFLVILDYTGVVDPGEKLALLVDNQTLIYILNLLVYVVFGFFLVVLALALYERLKAGSPSMMLVATAFGFIWAGLVIASGMVSNIGLGTVVALYGEDPALATTIWLAIEPVANGLGGEHEIVGGLWVLLVSWAALRSGGLPRILNYLGVVIGLAGILTVPVIYDVTVAIFGLGQIVWFIWLGIVLLRSSPSVMAQPSDAYVPRHRTS